MFVTDLPDMGPISVANHRMASLVFFRFTPREAKPLGHSVTYRLTQANDFRQLQTGSLSVDEDYEVTRISASWVRPWRRGDIEIEVPLLSRGGGILDPIIDGWHASVLGWSDPIRDNTPFGRSRVSLPGTRSFGSASGLGDVRGEVTQSIGRGLAWSAGVKLPTGDRSKLLGSGGVDGGLALRWSHDLPRRWRMHAMVGLVGQGDSGILAGTRGLIHQESIALVAAANSRDRWIVQWQSEAAPVSTGVRGADASHRIVTFGYRRRMSDRESLELYFSEDRDLFSGQWPEGANVGPDFVVGTSFSFRF